MLSRLTVPGVDELANRLPEGVQRRFPGWLPGWLRREIAYFSYSIRGADGETTSQEDIFAVSVPGGRVRRITDDRTLPVMKSDRDPAWSPDRSILAIHSATTVAPAATLRLIDATTGVLRRTLVPGHTPAWLDAGTLLFLDVVDGGTPSARDEVFAVDVASLAVRRITDVGPGALVSGLAWHPVAGLAVGLAEPDADRWSVGVVPAGAVAAARAAGGSPVPRSAVVPVTAPGARAGQPSWAPAGDRIAVTTWRDGSPSRIGVVDLATGRLDVLPGPGTGAGSLADHGAVFSRDGRLVAFVRGDEDEWTEIWVHDVRRGTSRQLTDDARTRFKAGLSW